jgi:chorismate mutase
MKRTYCCLAIAIFLLSVKTLKAQSSSGKPDQTMAVNRKIIDSVDKKLIELLGEREKAVKKIGIYKAQHNIPPLQAARFQEVLNNSIQAGEKQGLSADFITELMNAIHKESLRIEEELKKSSN